VCEATLLGHKDWVACVAGTPDGTRVASGGYDFTVRVFDVAARACVAVWTGHSGVVRSLAVLRDGRVVSGR